MEKRERPNRGFLVSIILLLGISVGMLHGRKKINRYPGPIYREKASLSSADLFDLLDPLLLSRSFDAAAAMIQQFDNPAIMSALEKILQKKHSNLSDEEKIKFLINIAIYGKSALKDQIFSLMATYYPVHPVFLAAVIDGKGSLVPHIVKWARMNNSTVLEEWIDFSSEQAIVRNSLDALDALYVQGIRPTKARASELLYQVVLNNKDPHLVSFLVDRLGADPNYTADKKRTVLIQAVENKNKELVQALLSAGANPSILLDDEVGTAKQIAYEKGFVEIESLLAEAVKKSGKKK